MNHYLLPFWAAGHAPSRFGNVAVRQLIDRLAAIGTARARLLAKVFGGACVNAHPPREDHLGLQNVQIAHHVLAAERIPVVAEDSGGAHGRRVLFHTHDGSAWVRRIQAA
jgi:chemotaxis protein CheD